MTSKGRNVIQKAPNYSLRFDSTLSRRSRCQKLLTSSYEVVKIQKSSNAFGGSMYQNIVKFRRVSNFSNQTFQLQFSNSPATFCRKKIIVAPFTIQNFTQNYASLIRRNAVLKQSKNARFNHVTSDVTNKRLKKEFIFIKNIYHHAS